ncbi:hypothetical protein [Kitasatospora sp. NPDC093558]|uniref:hypothetical protein n=1 Tax=Kitasatospora sp. NPDC093558 TaxID=3155201 RepID=UPI00341F24A8
MDDRLVAAWAEQVQDLHELAHAARPGWGLVAGCGLLLLLLARAPRSEGPS